MPEWIRSEPFPNLYSTLIEQTILSWTVPKTPLTKSWSWSRELERTTPYDRRLGCMTRCHKTLFSLNELYSLLVGHLRFWCPLASRGRGHCSTGLREAKLKDGNAAPSANGKLTDQSRVGLTGWHGLTSKLHSSLVSRPWLVVVLPSPLRLGTRPSRIFSATRRKTFSYREFPQ